MNKRPMWTIATLLVCYYHVIGARGSDVVFVLDGSGIMGEDMFNKGKDLIVQFVKSVTIGPSDVQVGLYINEFFHFVLNTYNSGNDVIAKLNNISYPSAPEQHVWRALEYIRWSMFWAYSGKRFNVSSYIIFISDGSGIEEYINEDVLDMSKKGVIFYGVWNGNFKVSSFSANFDLRSVEVSVIAGNIAASVTNTQQDRISGEDIVFLVDGSSNEVVEISWNFICGFANYLSIGPQSNQIGLIYYTNFNDGYFYLDKYTSDDLDTLISPCGFGSTNIENSKMAFQFIIYDMFALNNGKRFNTDTNIIVLSDGESTYDSPPEANTLKEKGVTIFTIGTNIHSNLSFLQTLASSSKHHFSLYGRQDIDVIKDILAIAGIGYSLPVTEPDCYTDPVSGEEIVFLVDGSSSMGYEGFERSWNFICSFAGYLSIGPLANQIGLIAYTNITGGYFLLNEYTSEETLIAALSSRRLSYAYSAKTSQSAFRCIDNNLLTFCSGKRLLTEANIIVLSDGSVNETYEADVLKAKGVTIFSVQVTSQSDSSYSQTYASSSEHHFSLYENDTTDVIKAILNMADIEYTIPITAPNCIPVSGEDFVFLIDGSSSMGYGGFRMSLNFICSFAGSITTGPYSNQIGVVIYTDNTIKTIPMNDYKSDDMASLRFPCSSSKNLTTALLHVQSDMLTPCRGKRLNVHTNIIVLSDGESTHESLDEAYKLKEKGVTIFTLETNAHSNSLALQMLSSSRKHHLELYKTEKRDVIKTILDIAGIEYSFPILAPDCPHGIDMITIVLGSVLPLVATIIGGLVLYKLWKTNKPKPPENCDMAPLGCYTWDLLLVVDQKDAAMVLSESVIHTLRTLRPRQGIKRTDVYRLRMCKEKIYCKHVVFFIYKEFTKIQDCLQILENTLISINVVNIFEFNNDFSQVLNQQHTYRETCWTRITKPLGISTNLTFENSHWTVPFLEFLFKCKRRKNCAVFVSVLGSGNSSTTGYITECLRGFGIYIKDQLSEEHELRIYFLNKPHADMKTFSTVYPTFVFLNEEELKLAISCKNVYTRNEAFLGLVHVLSAARVLSIS